MLEQVHHADRPAAELGLADPGHHLGGEQRVPAQVEEVVVDAERRSTPSTSRPDPGEQPLGRRRAARRVATDAARVTTGAGSALRSSLPFGVSGSASRVTNAAGTMYSGRRLPSAPPCSVGVLAAGADHVGDQPLVAGGVLADHHRGLGHAGLLAQRALDLAQLDPQAAQLDLVVDPAEELAAAPSAPPADQVAGAVQPGARVGPNGSGTNRSAVSAGRRW